MTTVDAQPSIYYGAASALHTIASDLSAAVNAKWGALSGCSGMSGSYDEAKKWSASYDLQTTMALDAATQLAMTMDKYGSALRTVGFNHEMADWSATIGNKGPAPVKPAAPDIPAVTMCRVPPPSAGGPGNGLSDVVGLAEKVGVIIPDGNPGKLGTIGNTWAALASDHAVTGLPDELGRIVNAVHLVKSPEVDTVLSDLAGMQTSARALEGQFNALAGACHDHETALCDLRDKLTKQLKALAKELAEQEAINLAIGAAASMLTFGLGAVVAVARTAQIVEKFAGPIREMVESWKAERAIAKGVKVEENIADETRKMQSLENRLDDDEFSDPGDSTWLADKNGITPNDAAVLNRGPSSLGGSRDGSSDLISAIREDRVTPRQQADMDAYNKALDKLPAYKGNVVRQTHLSPEQIAEYKPNQPYTEDGYTCTSTNMNGTGNGVNMGSTNVEYRMTSKTGRQIGDYGGTYDEVQFKDHTNFMVKANYFDPKLGKQIIVMDEL
ncbi:hypothetical protein [Nocardia alni]|uniref:hypothetical protein n=1 Tax=Nocardia alni TaxID=2815723 RepID=UPI001C231EC7|nr:hypothetical protein [Nocardia alni]